MSYLAGFPVRTSASPETVQASTVSSLAYGESRPASLARYDPASSTWKTAQRSLLAGLAESSVIFPRWGMMLDGALYPQKMPARHTCDSVFGLRLPTVTVCGNNNRKGASPMLPTPCARDYKDNGSSPAELARNSTTLATKAGGPLNPTWVEWLMGWPLGWTDLAPLETGRFQQWRRLHGAR